MFSGANSAIRFNKDRTNNYYKFSINGYAKGGGNIYSLFNMNTDISTAELSANYIFARIFMNCSGLIEAPLFPSLGPLKYESYYAMFVNCTSLTAAPYLPATTAGQNCYASMFLNCTSLISAHIGDCFLNTTVYYQNLMGMFENCSSLNYVEVDWTSWPSTDSNTQNWMKDVPATGTFVCPAALVSKIPSRDANGVPAGWTIV